MKSLLFAAALLLAPAAAQAQVAAASVPNTFDRPAQAAPVPAAAAPEATTTTPADARSEDTLRTIIAGAQAGALDYTLMTDDLAGKVREQEAAITALLQGFGAVQAVDFVGSQEGADLFGVTFASAATQWVIGFNADGKVAALLFRPAE
ncbi:MAG: hypothetical protein ACXW3O_14330 [Brevundimonas sp.]